MTKPEADANDGAVHFQLRAGSRSKSIAVSEARLDQGRSLVRTILREPFQRRTWAELAFFLISGAVACGAVLFVIVTLSAGVLLTVVFVGLLVIAGSLRATRGIGSWHRALARGLLDEPIADPEPFRPPPGFFGWLGAALRDGAAWRALAYSLIKMPLLLFGVWFGLSVWIEAFLCFSSLLTGSRGSVAGFGPFGGRINIGPVGPGSSGVVHPGVVFVYGAILVFVAPWAMRLVVYIDRRLMHLLLGPDSMSVRVRSLEASRAQTLDASAATLRRIERDLHDGTQAQLVALAMQLGQAKEELATGDQMDIEQIRLLVDQAHKGAKEAIVELARPGPRDPSTCPRHGPGKRPRHPGRSGRRAYGALGFHPVPAHPGDRGHRLFLCRRAVGQCRPARPGLSCVGVLRAARPVAADRGPGQWSGRGSVDPGGLVVERAGWTDRSGPGGRWPFEHRQPSGWPQRDHRRPAEPCLMGDAIRVVIAEDSAVLRDGLAQLLAGRGFCVTAVVSDATTLRTCIAQDCPDVAVVDIRMPPTFTDEGLQAALDLRQTHPGLGILLFSQYVETRYAAELLAGGAAGIGYLLKDRVADVRDFVDALVRVASGGTALDPEVITQLLGAVAPH